MTVTNKWNSNVCTAIYDNILWLVFLVQLAERVRREREREVILIS
jgi:hypothetical protein